VSALTGGLRLSSLFTLARHGVTLAMPISGAATSVSAFVGGAAEGPLDSPVPLSSFADFEARFGGLTPASPMSYAVAQFFGGGGRDALVVRVEQPGHTLTDDDLSGPALRDARRGLWALQRGPRFNLLCVPPLSLAADIGPTTRAQAAAIANACRAIFLADAVREWRDPGDLLDPSIGLDSSHWGLGRDANTACYFPRVRVADPLQDGMLIECAPCGLVAGIYARTDRERGVWRAPAGVDATLPGVIDLTTTLSAVQHEQLAARGVNALRRVSGGHVVWGGRTLQGDDRSNGEWKYVAVRRLFLYLEESIEQGLQWAAFEPNDENLWRRIRESVGDFMHSLFRQGAFQGRSAQEAWFVRCGAETTTGQDIDAGIVNVEVGFAPLKPAEFVIISIRLLLGEIAGAGERYGD
jgi:hypothetical protein